MVRDNGRSPLDLVLDALSDSRRRQVFAYVHTSDKGQFKLDDLVQEIVSQETASTEPSDTQRERVRIALHHQHLPKLDAAGLIEYDPRTDDVRYRGTIGAEFIDESKLLIAIELTADTIDQPM